MTPPRSAVSPPAPSPVWAGTEVPGVGWQRWVAGDVRGDALWRQRGAGTTSARAGSHVPHGGVGARPQHGTGWWSWSPPDTALDSGTGLLHTGDLGCCTGSQHFLPFSHPSEHPWPRAPVQLPHCQPCATPKTSLPHLAAGLGGPRGFGGQGLRGMGSVLPCHIAPPPQTTPAPQVWSDGALP